MARSTWRHPCRRRSTRARRGGTSGIGGRARCDVEPATGDAACVVEVVHVCSVPGLRGHAQTGARAMRASRSTRGGVKTEHYTRNQTDSNKGTASRSAEGKNVSGPPPRCVRCSFRNTPTPCSTYKGVCPVRMAVSLGAALGRNDEDARPTGCGAEPREIFLPFLLQNRPFSKEILTFRTPL